MSRVIDVTSRRPMPVRDRFAHPAGVTLPSDDANDAALLVPEIRSAIAAGTYSSGMIQLLSDVVRSGDRVLVIGAGLGVVSTMIAKSPGVERVVALEANVALTGYLQRVHALNGVPWVETLNGVPTVGKKGRVPFFARRDLRTSSLLPQTAAWQQALMVPLVDLNLILAEEQITLIACEIPSASARVLAEVEPGSVERIAIADEGSAPHPDDEAELVMLLMQRGFAVERARSALLLSRDASTAHRRRLSTGRVIRTGT